MKIKIFASTQIVDIKTYGIQELFRKFYLLIKILLKIPVYVIAIIPCIIIRLVSPWVIVRIVEMPSSTYGNFVICPAIYYCKKKLKIDQPKKKHIDLFYIHYKDKIFNKQLAEMWKRKLNFLSGYLLAPIDKVNKLIPGWKIYSIEEFVRHPRFEQHNDEEHLRKECQPLDFTSKEEIYGKKMLNKFGLKDDDKFVCFVVRDGAYQLQKIPSRYREWSYQDYRHTNIDNFILAAKELAKRGYYVFRMGVVANKPFDLKNPKIIDYANSNLRNDFMDVYLGAKCTFCLSTASGGDEVACILGKPVAIIVVPILDLFFRGIISKKCLLLTKHHILKKEKRKLSLSEIFSHGVAHVMDTAIFEQKGIELVENSPEEIKNLAIEMAKNLEFNKELNSEDEELQKTFNNLLDSNIKNIDFARLVKKNISYPNLQGQIKARFSTNFLRENKDWLK